MYDLLLNGKKVPSTKNKGRYKKFEIYSSLDFEFRASDFDSTILANIDTVQLKRLGFTQAKSRLVDWVNKSLETSGFYDTLTSNRSVETTNTIKALASETREYRQFKFVTLEPYQKSNIAKLNRLAMELLLGFPAKEMLEAVLTKEEVNDFGIRYNDGGILYSKEFREQDSALVNKQSSAFLKYNVANFTGLDKNRIELFDRFIEHLIDEKIKVTLFLTPYLPKVYQVYSNNPAYSQILAVEEYLHRKKVELNKFEIIGSYSPKPYDLNASDFYDGMHLKRSGIIKILAAHKLKTGY
jgi:hypothetical protein